LRDDADTTGAVYGQLAGVFFDVGKIPESWLERIAHKDLIGEFTLRLEFSSEFTHP
jgi:ADP-ribosylglycohydrolase